MLQRQIKVFEEDMEDVTRQKRDKAFAATMKMG